MALTKEEFERLRQNENMRQFLDFVSASESTEKYGYQHGFNNNFISDLKTHPRVLYSFPQTDGTKNKTGAAGRYQITIGTYDDIRKRYGLPDDFSPQNQDYIAIAKINDKGAIDDVLNADWESAIKKTGSVWASFPTSPYKQKHRDWGFVNNFFNKNYKPAQYLHREPIKPPPEPSYLERQKFADDFLNNEIKRIDELKKQYITQKNPMQLSNMGLSNFGLNNLKLDMRFDWVDDYLDELMK